jgi:hypothetical protein
MNAWVGVLLDLTIGSSDRGAEASLGQGEDR